MVVCLIATISSAAMTIIYAVPLADIDIWWHLATGRYFLHTAEFLSADPFGLAGAEITPGRELILNGYWLSQVFFYFLYQLFGLSGLVIMRIVLLLVPSITILVYGWHRKLFSLSVLLLALLCGAAMIDVSGIRPNHLTVAFVPLLFILLSEIGYSSDFKVGEGYNLRKALFLPPFMLVWANLHGGFLLGVAVVVLFTVSETVTHKLAGRSMSTLKKLWGIVILTVFVSLITPNGIQVYVQYLGFQGGVIQQKTSEYLSPLVLAKNGVLVYWPYFILLLLSVLVPVLCRFKVAVSRLVLLITMAALSLTAFRYAPLFVGSASILLIPDLLRLEDTFKARGALLLMTAFLGGYLLLNAISGYPQTLGALSKRTVDQARFPTGAVEFIDQKGLSGIIFNHFGWGGYLIWQEPDQVTTFVDGRSLNLPLFHAYTRALWLPKEMQLIFDQQNVDLILIPRLNRFTGELYAVTDFLWREKAWELVYRDRVGMLLVREGTFTGVKRLNKDLIYQDVLKDVEALRHTHIDRSRLERVAAIARDRLWSVR
jgi:hypothetical protein